MRKILACALVLGAAACSSTSREINSLNETERDLTAQIRALEDVRKANIALVAALKRKQSDGNSAKVQAEISKARAAYDAAMANLE